MKPSLKNNNRDIQTLGLLKEIDGNYYLEAAQAHQNGKHIAWVNATAPVEILYAMDVIPVYPENHAAIIQAKKTSPEISTYAEIEGYPIDLCSYALCDIGSTISGKSPLPGGLPKPDFLFLCNSQCGTLTKWFEVNSRRMDIPLYLIDMPSWSNDQPDQNSRDYVKRQFDEFILFLEGLTRKTFDWERFKEVLELSAKTCSLWNSIIEMGKAVPAPITVFEQFVAMSPVVTQRGTLTTLDFYRKLKSEMETRITEKTSAIPGERFRLYWDNLPIWCSIRTISEFLYSKKACLNSNSYTWGWTLLAPDPDDPFGSWAESHMHEFSTMFNLNGRVKKLVEMADEYSLDGFIIHMNRSCKTLSLDSLQLKDRVEKISGVPGIVIEADHGDPRFFSEDQILERLESYFDILEQRKKE
jgi:benzoyl-CoA reductase/2-hydroxyglutaryl-CoA dehydratase subunit BcrC/BadD/HgdB